MKDAVIFYFSGTGNTAWVSQHIADSLTKKGIETVAYNIERVSIENIRPLIKGKEYVGFGYPIYGSDLPQPMKEFLIRFPTLRQKTAFCFCTQERFSGDGARIIKSFMWHSQGKIKFAEHFNMPNNISIGKFGFKVANDDKHINPILEVTENKINMFTDHIKNNISVRRGFHMGSHLLGALQRIPFRCGYSWIQKSFSIDRGKCVNCGKCYENCPVNNISFKNNTYQIGDNCCLCMRCYNYCDSDAILFRKSRVSMMPYKGVDNYENELNNLTDRVYHNGSLSKPKEKRFFKSLFLDETGKFKKSFKKTISHFLIAVLCYIIVVNILTFLPIEVSFLCKSIVSFIIFCTIGIERFLYWQSEAKKRSVTKTHYAITGLLIAGMIVYSGINVISATVDVCIQPIYVTSKILDIRSRTTRYNHYKTVKLEDDSGIIQEYYLYNPVKDLNVGDTYTFRIMRKSNTAIAILEKEGDELF